METQDAQHRQHQEEEYVGSGWGNIRRLRALLAAIALIATSCGDTSATTTTEALTPGDAAVQSVEGFVAALSDGDADAALALMGPDQQADPITVNAVEFVAALPGAKTVSGCSAEGSTAFTVAVSCTFTIDGPLFQATGDASSTGTFNVNDELIVDFTPGFRRAAGAAFVEYASTTQPDAYDQVCRLDVYEPGTVRRAVGGFVFSGGCGSLWGQVADDAAFWVLVGKPPLTTEN